MEVRPAEAPLMEPAHGRKNRRSLDAETRHRERVCTFPKLFRNYNQVRANLSMHARTLTDSAGIAQHCGSVRAPPRYLEPTDHPQTPPLRSPTPLARSPDPDHPTRP